MIHAQEYATVEKKKTAPIEPAFKSMYADVTHLEDAKNGDVVDSNDVKYSAIAGTRSAPVSFESLFHGNPGPTVVPRKIHTGQNTIMMHLYVELSFIPLPTTPGI